jgi:hypothetical protein
MVFLSMGAVAQNVVFNNNDGTWSWQNSGANANDLVLSGSTLSSVSGLPGGYDCGSIATCGGSISIVTGALTGVTNLAGAQSALNPGNCNPSPVGMGPCAPANFGPGGSFTVSAPGLGSGLTFTGTFSSATWTKSGAGATNNAFWTFVGSITSGVLMLGGTEFTMINAGTIDITTVGNPFNGGAGTASNPDKWTDSFGSSNFPSPVPEPSTLALFGSGLILLGFLTKRKLSRKSEEGSF